MSWYKKKQIFDLLFMLFDDAETLFDNLAPSLKANISRGDTDLLIYDGMGWFTGTGASLAVVSIIVGWCFYKRYLNSWDALFVREEDRLRRIQQMLNSIDPNFLVNTDTEDLAHLMEGYSTDTALFCDEAVESDVVAINTKKKKKRAQKFKDFFTHWREMGLLPGNIENSTAINSISSKHLPLVESSTTITAAKPKLKPQLIDAIIALPKKFVDHYTFNIALSYTLCYWLVNFYTTMNVPVAPLLTPLDWALFALIFPIFFLLFKEIQTYRKRLIATDSNKPPLDFRRGWLFVALILAISLGFILSTAGFPIGIACLVGGTAFLGTCVFALLIFKIVDDSLAKKRLEQANKKTEETVKETPKERKERAARRRKLLDEIALHAYKLRLQSEIAQLRESFPDDQTGEIAKNQQPLNNQEKADNLSITPTSTTLIQKISLPLGTFLAFLNGFAMGTFIGWVIFQEFLAHLSDVFIMGSGGIVINFVIVVISVIAAIGFAQRHYANEKKKQAASQELITEKSKELNELKELRAKIAALRSELTALRTAAPPCTLEQEKIIEKAVNYSFVHPVKHRGITCRKVAFSILNCFKILANLSSASYIIRVIAFMALSQAICSIPGVTAFSSSLMLFGASANPVGIAIVSLILALWVIKSIYDVYFKMKEQKESKKIEHAEFEVAYKKVKLEHLIEQKKTIEAFFLNPANSLHSNEITLCKHAPVRIFQ